MVIKEALSIVNQNEPKSKGSESRNLGPTFYAVHMLNEPNNVFVSLTFFAGLYEELRRIEPDMAFCPRDNVDQACVHQSSLSDLKSEIVSYFLSNLTGFATELWNK